MALTNNNAVWPNPEEIPAAPENPETTSPNTPANPSTSPGDAPQEGGAGDNASGQNPPVSDEEFPAEIRDATPANSIVNPNTGLAELKFVEGGTEGNTEESPISPDEQEQAAIDPATKTRQIGAFSGHTAGAEVGDPVLYVFYDEVNRTDIIKPATITTVPTGGDSRGEVDLFIMDPPDHGQPCIVKRGIPHLGAAAGTEHSWLYTHEAFSAAYVEDLRIAMRTDPDH